MVTPVARVHLCDTHERPTVADLTLEVLIARPTNEVFTFLTDLENDLRWKTEWVDVKRTTNAAIGLGTRYSLFSKLLGRTIETVYETTEYVPETSATWTTVSGPLPMTVRRTFEPVETGTRVVVAYTSGISGVLRLFRPLIVAAGRRQNEGALRTVKRLLESSGS
jgi:hypothetical protein